MSPGSRRVNQTPPPGPWAARGVCHGAPTDLFFPGPGTSAEAAKAVCRQCPVLDHCRGYALSVSDLQGVWGGLAEEERHRLRQRLAGRI